MKKASIRVHMYMWVTSLNFTCLVQKHKETRFYRTRL
jgi:hypothetical protein